ncbi:MAG: precorrin-4 C(11)-methyltransferase [Rickettsiales bacterium]
MTIHFIGAGPGAADMITLRGKKLIESSPICLYAGSLVPEEMLSWCPKGAKIVNTAPLDLDKIEAEFIDAHEKGLDVARLHSGDLSIWSAMGEQIRLLKKLGIPHTITAGVPSFAASAAALSCELTLPELAQSLVLTRTSGRASAMPEGESLATFAKTGATIAVHLSIHALDKVVDELAPILGKDCPVAVVYRATWEDEKIIRATLGTIEKLVDNKEIERTALIIVGKVLAEENFRDSALYDADYHRRYRS